MQNDQNGYESADILMGKLLKIPRKSVKKKAVSATKRARNIKSNRDKSGGRR